MRQYHVALERGEIGRYVILPGNPGRVEKLAKFLDNPYFVRQNREYCTWNGTLDGELVSIVSTGIGGPSAAICLEELIEIGADTFIRTGTCGGLQPEIKRSHIIIPTGSVRGGATANAYVPPQFPSLANYEIVNHLAATARELGSPYHTGIVQCKDAFYLEDPDKLPNGIKARQDWEMWVKAGVLASEMESDTLFVIGSIRKVRVGTVLISLGGRAEEGPMIGTTPEDLEHMMGCALGAIRRCIRENKK